MEQKEFMAILQRYLRGEATPSEKNLIEGWYASIKQNVSDQEIPNEDQLKALYQKTIYPYVRRSTLQDNVRRFFPWYATGIAASLLIIISSYFIFLPERRDDSMIVQETQTSNTWKHVANTSKNQQVIVLPDSSKVTLQPESDLHFSTVFNTTNREVYLEGEATFEVTHNASLPFLVFANEVTTKVLGTSFTVRAMKDEQRITVAVKTGKVSVYADSKKETRTSPEREIILTPNQQVVYDKKQNEISKTLVEKPRVILPEEEVKRMRFEDAPIAEIFKALEKAYGVDIEFDEEQFSSCAMTTVISDDDFFHRLDIICDAMGITYTKEKDRIVISSAGCKAKF